MRHALSVDVEDWFQVGAFEKVIDRDDWDSLSSRVERNTDAVLALFAESGVKATFFTLGWVAQRYPALIRRIVEQGHELASHGWDHRRVFTMDARSFAADLARTRETLQDAGGVSVSGYRAPSFSIDQRTPWAHHVLAEVRRHFNREVVLARVDGGVADQKRRVDLRKLRRVERDVDDGTDDLNDATHGIRGKVGCHDVFSFLRETRITLVSSREVVQYAAAGGAFDGD